MDDNFQSQLEVYQNPNTYPELTSDCDSSKYKRLLRKSNCPMHFEMFTTKFLLSSFLVVLWCQNAQFEEIPVQEETFDVFFDNTLESKALIANNKRNIKDVWNNIKNSITNSWNALKTFAKSSKEKMKNMTEKVKARAREVVKSFQNHMAVLKQKFNDVIKKVFDETEIVKKCLIEEREAIENFIKEITQHLTVLHGWKSEKLSVVHVDTAKAMNDTDFFKDLENKFKGVWNKI
ncbi:uncharacterized protein LOC115445773 [Manduca sexta]|uniref:uncharacterized protein LOC115445773 n=1 Tax=Manduca sexta TaxID=7130 RepID=UPI00188E1A60|nr:uncharacterized protein LOC115445773 [Manduca sexta]